MTPLYRELITEILTERSSGDIYTETNFPSYAFLESRKVSYLTERSYEYAKRQYVGNPVPLQYDSKIPEKYKDLPWSTYAIILSLRYESG